MGFCWGCTPLLPIGCCSSCGLRTRLEAGFSSPLPPSSSLLEQDIDHDADEDEGGKGDEYSDDD